MFRTYGAVFCWCRKSDDSDSASDECASESDLFSFSNSPRESRLDISTVPISEGHNQLFSMVCWLDWDIGKLESQLRLDII